MAGLKKALSGLAIVALGLTAVWDAPAGNRSQIENAVEILERVDSGRALLEKAKAFWKLESRGDVLSVLKWGTASKTDATLTRHFDPKTGQEVRERKVLIQLRPGQSLHDLTLDIAHELVHATSRPAFDPYDVALTPGKYIHQAIEGDGGEVEAVFAECQVAREIQSSFGLQAERCKHYFENGEKDSSVTTSVLRKEKIKKDFYRVGSWRRELIERLGRESTLFPILSADKPRLYSSTGGTPYPVALMGEYEEITRIACENSRKRVAVLGAGRGPASSRSEAEESTRKFLADRCH